jgi:uncharacterized protein (DUF2147 family)
MFERRERYVKRLAVLVVLTVFFCAGAVQAAESLLGKWNAIDEKTGEVTSEVDLYEQNGQLFGKITSIPEPNDSDGKPKICKECSGPDRDQPIIGLVIIKNLSRKGDRYKGGTLLDPNDGKIYKTEVWTEGEMLKVRGYIGFFFRTQTWVKAR